MTNLYHVVLVEDDEMLLKVLTNALSKHEFHVSAFSSGQAACDFIVNSHQSPFGNVHILVSDVVLPDITGLDIIRQLGHYAPLGKILISVNGQDQDKISGLLVGADDYLSKPVNPEELLLRVRALIRRLPFDDDSDLISFLNFKLNPETGLVSNEAQQSALGQTELSLLLLLISRQGKIVSRKSIIEVLGNEYQKGRALDMLISRLRKKLGDVDDKNQLIVTVRGKGLMLVRS